MTVENGEGNVSKKLENLDPQALAELNAVLQRAEAGDRSALTDLKKILDDYPEISRRYGDLGLQAIEAWVQLVAGPNLLLHESLNRKLDDMRTELLGGADAPLLERLLVDQILATWLQVCHADALFAQGTGPATALQLNQRQTGAQHRFLKSVQALATLRKLLRVVPSPVQIASRLTACGKERTPAPPSRRADLAVCTAN